MPFKELGAFGDGVADEQDKESVSDAMSVLSAPVFRTCSSESGQGLQVKWTSLPYSGGFPGSVAKSTPPSKRLTPPQEMRPPPKRAKDEPPQSNEEPASMDVIEWDRSSEPAFGGSKPAEGSAGPAPGGPGPAVGGPEPACGVSGGETEAAQSLQATPAVEASMQYEKPDSSGSEHCDSGSAPQEEAASTATPAAAPTATPAAATSMATQEPAFGGSESADGGSSSDEDLSHAPNEFDEFGHYIQHDTTNMQPVQNTIYFDNITKRYYNSKGTWVDKLGRPLPHRGPAGKYRSRGTRSQGNTNPGGPGANPPQVQARFGPRSHCPNAGEPASRSGSRRPPEAAARGSGDPGPARGGRQRRPPLHRPARGGPSDWSQWRSREESGQADASQGLPEAARSNYQHNLEYLSETLDERISRANSTGPRQAGHRSMANRWD